MPEVQPVPPPESARVRGVSWSAPALEGRRSGGVGLDSHLRERRRDLGQEHRAGALGGAPAARAGQPAQPKRPNRRSPGGASAQDARLLLAGTREGVAPNGTLPPLPARDLEGHLDRAVGAVRPLPNRVLGPRAI